MRRSIARFGAWSCGAVMWCIASPVDATYSIVATDSNARWVGGAGTSCVGSLDVRIILGTAPGFGAVHAQAQINTQGRDEAVAELLAGTAPVDIIAAITSPRFDALASARQYGIVDLQGRAAGHTGATNGEYAEDRNGQVETFTYSVQGNILTGPAVLDQAQMAFVEGNGCDMVDALMLALEAGAQGGEGDSRCTPDGIPSDSAFITVVDERGNTIIDLSVTDTAPASPLLELREQYDLWRMDHPCVDDGGSSSGGSSGGDESTGSADATSEAEPSTGDADPSSDGPSASTGIDGASTSASASGTGTLPQDDAGDEGCGCRLPDSTSDSGSGHTSWLLAVLLLLGRRRSKATVLSRRGIESPTSASAPGP